MRGQFPFVASLENSYDLSYITKKINLYKKLFTKQNGKRITIWKRNGKTQAKEMGAQEWEEEGQALSLT